MDKKRDDHLNKSDPTHEKDQRPHWEEVGRGTSKIPKGAAEILKNYFDAHQMREAGQYHSFFSSWGDLAGMDISAHSKPRDIRNSVLIVEVDHPGWVQMLHLQKGSILSKIRRTFPELKIRDIRSVLYENPDADRVEPLKESPPPTPAPEEPRKKAEPSPEEDQRRQRMDEALHRILSSLSDNGVD
ncbi:MAG TPA: DUF721 domain-containing protein [Sediminispirochaeta sp.]|nr:DUF721 domain-containing protein [Sediminispirochaeta sp.]